MLNDLRSVLTTILDAYPAGAIVVFDADLRYVFAGGDGLAGVMLDSKEMVGCTPAELFPGEVGQGIERSYRRCLTGERFHEITEFRDRIYKVTHTPVRSGGEIVGGLVITVDQTSSLQANAARDTATARYQTLIRTFPGAAFLFDEDGRYLLAGGQALAIFGQSQDELEGKTPEEALGAEAGGWIRSHLDMAMERGEVVTDVGSSIGRTFEVRFVAVDGEEHGGVVAMAVDVHDQRRAQVRAEEALAHQEALLKEVHHRVKNHLQVVQSLLGITARRVKSEVARRALRDVRDRVQAMSVVHGELYRRGDTSRVRLDGFLGRLVGQLRRSLPALGRVELNSDFQALDGDNTVALHLGLVVTELVSNAAEHAYVGRDGGRLDLALRLDDDSLELMVRDDGPGLSKSDGDEDSLGLWLVRALTQPRGGTVVDHSDGAGVCWRVRIPVGEDAVAPVAPGD